MAEPKSESMFKRGELDFKTVLNKQLDRILEKLTEGEMEKFTNGVEGLYLVLFYYLEKDREFLDADESIMKFINEDINKVINDLRIQPEAKELKLGDIGIGASKMRLALIDKVLGKRRLLLETRRMWDERTGPTAATTEPTEAELRAIVASSPAEEQD